VPLAPLRALSAATHGAASNLPQLLLFADHLDVCGCDYPATLRADVGKSHTNLQAILAEHTDEEKAWPAKPH